MKLTKVNADESGDNNFSFDNILNELDNETLFVKTIGDVEIKALTMKQQRKIMGGGYDNVEISAKFSDIYNDFIRENVTLKDEIVSPGQVITLEMRPFILNALRVVSLGNVYYDDETDKEYIMAEPTPEDMKPHIPDKDIEFGNIKITLSVPNLDRDTKYNGHLCTALGPYKKKRNFSDSDAFPVMDLYQLYEIFKYISVVSFKGRDYDFDKVAMNDKTRLVNGLHATIVNQITDYIKEVEDVKERALKATNKETGESVIPNFYTMFFAKTTRKG